jgi:hypothetical protein
MDAVAIATPLDELKRRYEALGEIRELPGERTYLGRCSSFDRFLINGPAYARDLRTSHYDFSIEKEQAPGLAELCLEAWPDT